MSATDILYHSIQKQNSNAHNWDSNFGVALIKNQTTEAASY